MILSPLTKSKNIVLIQEYSVSELADKWKQSFDINILNQFKKIERIQLFQCQDTGLLFFKPDSATGTEKLYEQLAQFPWFYMSCKWEYDVALQEIKSGDHVLEVGAAFGYFVQAGLKKGLKIQGIELNSSAVAKAQKKGLPIQKILIEDFAEKFPESQDVVCAFQVLEHIPNPLEFLDSAISSLKKNGKLILCVPNSESFLKYQDNLLDMPPHHMLRWSQKSFESLESLLPLKLEKVCFEPLAKYHVDGFVSAYGNHLRQDSKYPLIFNKITYKIVALILKLGFHKNLLGQSIYVQFRKI